MDGIEDVADSAFRHCTSYVAVFGRALELAECAAISKMRNNWATP